MIATYHVVASAIRPTNIVPLHHNNVNDVPELAWRLPRSYRPARG
jgi:hypothetical protein